LHSTTTRLIHSTNFESVENVVEFEFELRHIPKYSLCEIMQRIFKYGDIQNINITPNQERNILL